MTTEPSAECQRGLSFGDPTPPLRAQQRDMYREETWLLDFSYRIFRVFSQSLPEVGYG